MEQKTIINSKFITSDVILQSLTRVHKRINWEPSDVLEWSMEMEVDYIGDADNMARFIEIKLPVNKNKQARIPCNRYRILDVYTDPKNPKSKVSWEDNGAYIDLDINYQYDYVYINYLGTHIDLETGQPLIMVSHKAACEALCVKNAYYEPYLNNEINGQQWGYIVKELDDKTNGAQCDYTRWMDRQDFENLAIIQGNMITKIGTYTLYQNTVGY